LHGGQKKLSGKVGEATNHTRYIEGVPNYYLRRIDKHKMLGKVFKLNNRDIVKRWEPFKPSKLTNKKQASFIKRLLKVLDLSIDAIRIGGSNMFSGQLSSKNDVDIIIQGRKNSKIALRKIREIIYKGDQGIYLKNGSFHHRRFWFEGKQICPFASHTLEDKYDNLKIDTAEEAEEIKAEVIDDSNSLFSPAIYMLKTGKGKFPLLSYHVGHLMLFHKRDNITFKAQRYLLNHNGNEEKVYVISTGGTWVTIDRNGF